MTLTRSRRWHDRVAAMGCASCSAPLFKRSQKKFFSRRCSGKALITRKRVACIVCGSLFPEYDTNKKFCSLPCRDAHLLAKRVRDGEARCANCKHWKPVDAFVTASRRRSNGDTYKVPHSYCKACNNIIFERLRRKRGQKPFVRRTPDERRALKNLHQRVNNMRKRAEGKAGKKLIEEMLEAQGGRCTYCLCDISTSFHVDHKQPIARGGTNDRDNLHLTCPTCNLRKNTRTHDEFMASKRRPLLRGSR